MFISLIAQSHYLASVEEVIAKYGRFMPEKLAKFKSTTAIFENMVLGKLAKIREYVARIRWMKQGVKRYI